MPPSSGLIRFWHLRPYRNRPQVRTLAKLLPLASGFSPGHLQSSFLASSMTLATRSQGVFALRQNHFQIRSGSILTVMGGLIPMDAFARLL